MTIDTLNLIIWVPFALVVLFTFIITGISGFKKGVWRALMSFGGVIVATVLSILLSSLFSKLLTSRFSGLIVEALQDTDVPPALLGMVADMVVGCVLSIVLFGLLMIILSIVFHIISMKIKPDRFTVSSKGLKWAGLGVGLATAVLFALVFLAPAYGTIGTATGIVAQLSDTTAQNDSSDSFGDPQEITVEKALDTISKHPLVSVSSSGPISVVNNSVVNLDVGGQTLSIPAIMSTFEELAVKLEEISMADEDEIEALCADFIATLKKDVVHTGWSYAAYQMAVSAATDYVNENITEELAEFDITPFVDALDITKDEFFTNCDALLDFMQYALERDLLEYVETQDIEILYQNGIIAEAGKLANCSEQAVFVKKIILAGVVSDIFDGDFVKAMAFVDTMQIGEVTNPEEQLQEAEAIFVALGMSQGTNLEVILRHPQLGEDAAEALSAICEPIQLFGGYGDELNEIIESSPEIRTALFENAKESAELPLGESSERNLMDALEACYGYNLEGYYYNSSSPETTLKALKLLGREKFASSWNATGAEDYDVVKKCLEIATKIDDCPDDYMICITETNALIATVQGKIQKSWRYTLIDAYDIYYHTDSGFDFLIQLSHLGSNPFGISLSSSEKSEIKDAADYLLNTTLVNEGDPKATVNYSYVGSASSNSEGFLVVDSNMAGQSFATSSSDVYQIQTYTAEEAEEHNSKVLFIVNAILTLLGV